MKRESSTAGLVLAPAARARILSSHTTRLADALIARLKPGGDFRYHPAWAWGYWLTFLPARIGQSPALDSAVIALLASHTDLCQKSTNIQPSGPLVPNELIALYNKALSHLRDALNDSNMCSRVEILLAVMVLAIIQVR